MSALWVLLKSEPIRTVFCFFVFCLLWIFGSTFIKKSEQKKKNRSDNKNLLSGIVTLEAVYITWTTKDWTFPTETLAKWSWDIVFGNTSLILTFLGFIMSVQYFPCYHQTLVLRNIKTIFHQLVRVLGLAFPSQMCVYSALHRALKWWNTKFVCRTLFRV